MRRPFTKRGVGGRARRAAGLAIPIALWWNMQAWGQVPDDAPAPAPTDGPVTEVAEPVVADAEPPPTAAAPEQGRASWYGSRFAGRRTACGGHFDPRKLTMAHPTLPCGTHARVTNMRNHRSVIVVVTDRGPFVPGRIADLSRAAARLLGIARHGAGIVTIEPLEGVP